MTHLDETEKYKSELSYKDEQNEDNFIENNIQTQNFDYYENGEKIEMDPTIYYSLNINEICNSFENSKKNFLLFEKKINTKLYHNENKLIQVKNTLEDNNQNILMYHNNILNETIKSNYTKTEHNQSFDNILLKTSEFNVEGKEYYRVYLKALYLFNNNNFNEAFSLIVEDEIYLLRLLFMARDRLNEICPLLNKDLYQKILLKINHICHSHFVAKIQNMIKNSINNKQKKYK